MKIAVLGATGRTGRVAAQVVKANGDAVRHVVRSEVRAEWFRERGEDVAVARLHDRAALTVAMRGASAVFAILPDDFACKTFHATRERIGDAIADAVREAEVPRVVFVSSSIAPLSQGFGRGLAHAERRLLASGAAVTILRAAYFQDNVLGAAAYARAQGVFVNFFPGPDHRIPTVAARDVGLAAGRALLGEPNDGEIIYVNGPSYSPREIAVILGRALGRTLALTDVPAATHASLFGGWGMSPEAARAMAETLACLASEAVTRGRRIELGTTTLDETLRASLGTPMCREEGVLR